MADASATFSDITRFCSGWLASQGSDGFAYRLLDFNPGFSLVAIDPTASGGQVIVEFHGFHSESTNQRRPGCTLS